MSDGSTDRALSTVAEHLGRLSDGASEAAACEVLTSAAHAVDAEAAFLTVLQDETGMETLRVVVGCDPDWSLEYESNSAFADDPWLRHARRSSEPRQIADIPPANCRERATVEMAKRFGFVNGVVVPMHSPAGMTRLGVLYLAVEGREGEASHAPADRVFAASGIAVALHRWQLARLRSELIATAQLNTADLRLLRYERERRTSKEIARLTGWSPLSIDSRWQRLNARLGVTSRRRAALLASEYGVI